MPKFLRLPSLKRCNTRGNFPFHYKKYYPQIYSDGLPENYIPLDYSLGHKTYINLYNYLRRGIVKGIIYKDKNNNKWRYAVKPEDIKLRRTKIKERCQDALIKLKDLDAQMYVSLNKAAKLIGFNYETLKAHFDRENLECYFPLPEDYVALHLDTKTKYIVKVEELRIWLNLILDGTIISRAAFKPKDPRCTSATSKYSARRRANLKYQDTRQIAFGTYGGWRPKPQTKK